MPSHVRMLLKRGSQVHSKPPQIEDILRRWIAPEDLVKTLLMKPRWTRVSRMYQKAKAKGMIGELFMCRDRRGLRSSRSAWCRKLNRSKTKAVPVPQLRDLEEVAAEPARPGRIHFVRHVNAAAEEDRRQAEQFIQVPPGQPVWGQQVVQMDAVADQWAEMAGAAQAPRQADPLNAVFLRW